MYAVFEDSGTQFIVREGDTLLVDYRDIKVGEQLEFDKVLAKGEGDSLEIGKPYLDNQKVVAEVLEQTHSEKIHVRTFKRRKNFKRHKGHKQPMTQIKITAI